ncbi:uncharacterized protein E5676_scaffold451G00690 [Cucumis melo var. makuwa]|uniref:RNase H type-1 domain-containing protein n=1 Tax=Cucumis melo var. makuwa TaxID=1194695 RepID=A0A5A7ULI7_CUCMM|nr:uncharacterized protein E6C27_scaffold323G00020 [Cucumis melo var. makuwa]TYK01510.1 uncharacterized protein E5676_scaffold451G00690 [Cucumis melo var. makuwa]
MNPLKCTFGVTSGKFLDFIVKHRGTEIDQSNIDVIQKIPRRKSLHDLRSLQERLAYIQRLISNLAGIVLISLEKHMLPYCFALAELCSNNVAKYQALIIGLQMTLEIGVSFIEIYGDSKLIINQLLLQYDMKHEDLKSYFAYARQLMEKFNSVMLEHVPRTENKRANTLVNLAIALMMSDDVAMNIPLCQQHIMPPNLSDCQEVNVTTSI